MHIAEGFLPLGHASSWTVVAAGPVLLGVRALQETRAGASGMRLLFAAAGAFLFLLSSLKLPSVAGSSSHLTGAGLGALLVGAVPMAALGVLVLVFQALLLAHGGLTTLGANTVALAVVGPWVTVGLHSLLHRLGAPSHWRVGLATGLGALATYFCTAGQLALAFPDATGSHSAAFQRFAALFAVTQVPLAIVEGAVSAWAFTLLRDAAGPELAALAGDARG